jgi:hypothetical protein
MAWIAWHESGRTSSISRSSVDQRFRKRTLLGAHPYPILQHTIVGIPESLGRASGAVMCRFKSPNMRAANKHAQEGSPGEFTKRAFPIRRSPFTRDAAVSTSRSMKARKIRHGAYAARVLPRCDMRDRQVSGRLILTRRRPHVASPRAPATLRLSSFLRRRRYWARRRCR